MNLSRIWQRLFQRRNASSSVRWRRKHRISGALMSRSPRPPHARWRPLITVAMGTPRAVWVCGSKKISAWRDVVGGRTLEISGGQVVEILLGQQHAGAGIVDVEERLQVGERVGARAIPRLSVRERDAVAPGQRENQFGFERAFNMDMQFCFWHLLHDAA